jgi:hypothetical protein
MAKNMWPHVRAGNVRTPLLILREQAGLLGRMTKNVVTARVTDGHVGKDFVYSLSLVAPALDYYSYTILTIRHTVKVYPLTIEDHVNETRYEAATESEFLQALQAILKSDEVKRVIELLLSQSAALGHPQPSGLVSPPQPPLAYPLPSLAPLAPSPEPIVPASPVPKPASPSIPAIRHRRLR